MHFYVFFDADFKSEVSFFRSPLVFKYKNFVLYYLDSPSVSEAENAHSVFYGPSNTLFLLLKN